MILVSKVKRLFVRITGSKYVNSRNVAKLFGMFYNIFLQIAFFFALNVQK